MRKTTLVVVVAIGAALLPGAGTAFAQATVASKSLEKCQNTVQKETAKAVKGEQRALASCLGTIARKVVRDNQAAVNSSGATAACLGQFYKIGRSDGRSVAAKMAAKVGVSCDPANAKFKGAHIADDVLGTGIPGVSQPLDVSLNNTAYCGSFATGSTTLAEWTGCLQAAASCAARQQVLVEFPRAIEWLNLMDAEFAASADVRVVDARPALQAALAAMDGNSDGAPDLACGPAGAGGGGGGGPFALLATGQTTCWNTSGTVIACPGTGEDGDLRFGAVLSYTDNGDGTITDNNTGLMWEKKSNDGGIHDQNTTYTWGNAFSVHIASLNAGAGFAGYTDWRLPNTRELESLVERETYTPSIRPPFDSGCSGICSVTVCSCTAPSNYWTSTSDARFPTGAWLVNFNTGLIESITKSAHEIVRAVRGGA